MNVLFTSIVGSTMHGTMVQGSDLDVRHVYKNSLRVQLSPFNHDSSRIGEKQPNVDEDTYELSHFVRMLAKCNPTAMEVVCAVNEGDKALATELFLAALDTVKYAQQCNGFVKGMFHANTPKSLHHGVRVALHLRRYLLTGDVDFDATSYPEFEDLMRIKLGLLTPPPQMFDAQEPTTIFHRQDLTRLEEIVYNQYLAELTDGGTT